jgi:hypothetical protein
VQLHISNNLFFKKNYFLNIKNSVLSTTSKIEQYYEIDKNKIDIKYKNYNYFKIKDIVDGSAIIYFKKNYYDDDKNSLIDSIKETNINLISINKDMQILNWEEVLKKHGSKNNYKSIQYFIDNLTNEKIKNEDKLIKYDENLEKMLSIVNILFFYFFN